MHLQMNEYFASNPFISLEVLCYTGFSVFKKIKQITYTMYVNIHMYVNLVMSWGFGPNLCCWCIMYFGYKKPIKLYGYIKGSHYTIACYGYILKSQFPHK